ncbi:hypothetical protein FS837_004717 [Tulasnella sp. UAMH 9824]|nr:hypothetical protein FS837_004717 [Tulasnella sp. UAMH 9824]
MLRHSIEPPKRAETPQEKRTESEDNPQPDRKVQFGDTPEEQDEPLEELPKKNLRSATFGHDGSWALVEIDGTVRCHGLHPDIEQKLKERPVRKAQLCRFSPSYYYIRYSDGTSTWEVPPEWRLDIENVEYVDIAHDSQSNFHPPIKDIVFSFGPDPNLFCISAQGVTKWKNCSKQLADLLRQTGTPSSVSMGEGGAFHWKMGRGSVISPDTEFAYPEVWKIFKSGEHIKWVAFGPDGRYVVQTTKQTYSSQQRLLIRTFGGGDQVPTLCASFGYGGSWVIVEGDDGTVRTHGVSRAIRDAILRKNVRHIHLSQTDPDHYFIEYRDHTTAWSLPASWHESVQSVEKLIFENPEDTSSRATSPPTSSGGSSFGTSPSVASADSSDPFTLGDVWRGKLKLNPDSEEEEDVAMKVLRAVRMSNRAGLGLTLTERMRKRMNRETEIWSRLNHPNVVPLRGYALQDDGTPMIISPWFEHGDVHNYLEDYPDADRKKIVRQVAEGLVYLHSQDPPVVHGDLKGGNVLISKEGDAALCDFGLSTLLMVNPATMTMSTVAVGTVRWCAPELLTSNVPEKTPASDVWAFAALALEVFDSLSLWLPLLTWEAQILTGRIPFHTCTNDAKVIHDIAFGKIPAREDYPELHPDSQFWGVLESCWQQEPSDRPSMETLKPLIFDDQTFSPN